MGKAAVRRKIGKLLKDLKIPAKLYRGSKLNAFRVFSGTYLRSLLKRLELSKPGTVVGDCGVVNHVVKGFAYNDFQSKTCHANGYHLDFPQLIFEDGSWSCGCETSPEPPHSREWIEIFLLKSYSNPQPGWPLSDDQKKLRDILLKGEHVVDERGILLDSNLSTMYTG